MYMYHLREYVVGFARLAWKQQQNLIPNFVSDLIPAMTSCTEATHCQTWELYHGTWG